MNLLDYLGNIPDFRRKEGLRYRLDALTIQILAIMSGCISNRAIARFAKNHEQELCEFLPLKHGVPSHVTLREVSLHIDIASVQEQFNAWAARLFTADEFASLQQRIIAFDGKSLRATMKMRFIPKKTIDTIVETGNDYLAHVKGSQLHLLKALHTTTERTASNGCAERCERTRGRTEYSRCSVWTDVSALDTQRWRGVQSILKVERWGIRNGQEYMRTHWFITSLQAMPDVLAQIVRLH